MSLDLKRRHLDESQHAMVEAKIANLIRGGDRKSDNLDFDLAPATNSSVIRAGSISTW
jgi:hypothetical protein